MPKLTKTRVDALLPTGKRYAVTDSTLPGFEIRVGISGTKTAAVIYRKGGRLRRVTLGKISELYTFAQARVDAAVVLVAVKAGRDPAAERKTNRSAPTLAVAAQRYIDEIRPRAKATTLRKYDSVLTHQLLPALGGMRVSDIDTADVARLHAKIGETTRASANYAVTVLSAILRRTEAWGLRPRGSNPCTDVPRFTERPRSRVLSAEERARLSRTLDEQEAKGSTWVGYLDAIRLLSMTAARSSEIVWLTWEAVDIDRALLHLPDSKTGPRIIPLSQQALGYLARLSERRGSSPWVCPNPYGRRLTGINRVWIRLRVLAALTDVRLHDLRRTAATDALEAGVPLAMVSGVLGHRRIRTTEGYVFPSTSAYREAAQRMGDRIEEQTKAGAEKLREKK